MQDLDVNEEQMQLILSNCKSVQCKSVKRYGALC